MATLSTAPVREGERLRVVNVVRVGIAGGATAALVFVLCWLGTFVPFSSPTHAYIGMFTNADFRSGQAVVEGTLWSLLFGLLVGAAFALIYNATAALERK